MPTIKDVAKLAQVSSATVSRILNNDATLSVPEETRRTVLQAAETLHYIKKRREIRQALRQAGFLVTEIATSYERKSRYYHLTFSCYIEESEE